MGACGGSFEYVNYTAEQVMEERTREALRAKADMLRQLASARGGMAERSAPRSQTMPAGRSRTMPSSGALPRLGLLGDPSRGEQPRVRRANTSCELRYCEKDAARQGAPMDRSKVCPADEQACRSVSHRAEIVDSRPDFSGMWVCTGVEGDWDKFLRDQGAGWAMRKAVASLGYGVGQQVQTIEQDSETIKITSTIAQPAKKSEAILRLDGGSERITNLEGRPCISTTTWDGDHLLTREASVVSCRPSVTIRRWLEGARMCTERTSPTGTVVRRFYARKA